MDNTRPIDLAQRRLQSVLFRLTFSLQFLEFPSELCSFIRDGRNVGRRTFELDLQLALAIGYRGAKARIVAARVCREALLDSRVFAVACQRLLGVIRAFCFKLVRNGENRIADPLQDDRV